MSKPDQVAVFTADAADEIFFCFNSTHCDDFRSEAEAVMKKYSMLQQENNCSIDTEVMLRFHLSDVLTQGQVLREIIGADRSSFVSFVGQPPVNGARLALEAYHIRVDGKLDKRIIDQGNAHELDVKLKNYELFLHCRRKLKPGTSFEQTEEECKTLNAALTAREATFMDNCLRTWFYARDIDNNYSGVADARREYFETIGMNKDTHYVASTGIEGQCEEPHRLVGMDSFNVFGISTDQIEFMNALDYMPPTIVYNVTFERGTKVNYGDRSHYYVSGTASIDADGNVMHPGDVRMQTRRMVEVVDALLKNHGGSFKDMKIASVYLRDGADADIVEEELKTLFPDTLPRIVVVGPVCRPGWLIEMEGIAVNRQCKPEYPVFE